MKTLKIRLLIIVALFAVGFSQGNAQAVVDKDYVYSGPLVVTCTNNGQVEELVGELHQHAVFLYDKEGQMKRVVLSYVGGSYYSQIKDEHFDIHGASNLNFVGDWNLTRFYETVLLFGDKGTKILVKTKFTINQNGDLEMELFFEKCV